MCTGSRFAHGVWNGLTDVIVGKGGPSIWWRFKAFCAHRNFIIPCIRDHACCSDSALKVLVVETTEFSMRFPCRDTVTLSSVYLTAPIIVQEVILPYCEL